MSKVEVWLDFKIVRTGMAGAFRKYEKIGGVWILVKTNRRIKQ